MTTPIPEEPHVKVTMQAMYREQQETNKLLTKTVTHLEALQDLPERVRALELNAARDQIVVADVKTAQNTSRAAGVAAILAIGTTLFTNFFK